MKAFYNILKVVWKTISYLFRLPVFLFRNNKIGKHTIIEKKVYLKDSIIGDYCYIGMSDYLNTVQTGNYCSIAGGVGIGALEHPWTNYSTSTRLNPSEEFMTKKTIIGNDVWIGTKCYIRQGVTIGDGAVVGACSFVNKDVPPYAIVFGCPAKIYKFRFDEKTIAQLTESRYWDYEPSEAKKILSKIKQSNDGI